MWRMAGQDGSAASGGRKRESVYVLGTKTAFLRCFWSALRRDRARDVCLCAGRAAGWQLNISKWSMYVLATYVPNTFFMLNGKRVGCESFLGPLVCLNTWRWQWEEDGLCCCSFLAQPGQTPATDTNPLKMSGSKVQNGPLVLRAKKSIQKGVDRRGIQML